ncbi:hypothetical protein Back2_01200 [Nocardioides baekrokdamisoli]|uniref:Lysoplasmalogenase n=1 Tax=Nocardioides baekrokdamisoli TaxID=1804624 RepID=A0A3G9IUG3_9ACTN|nr:lysoplasmalogenase [Nocardioides baekrokdamisoli]BBH15833.1 hypothetical protein Back2_01200 [Nocardioides baekrokdamisoli]
MVVLFSVLAGVLALTDFYAVIRERGDIERWAKPLTVPLMGLAAVSAGVLHHQAGVWLLAAVVFGALGDIGLLGDAPLGRFRLGVIAFFIGHAAYVAAFVSLGLPSPGWSGVSVGILLLLLWATRNLLPTALKVDGLGLAVPLGAYSLMIGAMLVTGWLTGSALIAAGATIFALSDTHLGRQLTWRRFRQPTGGPLLAVMVTYYAGQALLIAGVVHAL